MKLWGGGRYTCNMEGGGRTGACPWWGGGGEGVLPPLEMGKKDDVRRNYNLSPILY